MKKEHRYSAFAQTDNSTWRFGLVEIRANNMKEAIKKIKSYCRKDGLVEKGSLRRLD